MKSIIRALALGLFFLSPFTSPAALAESFCVPGPGDIPETTLQGGLTNDKLNAPGGFQGEQCGMRRVGYEPLGLRGSFGDVQIIGHCAYASMRDPSNLAHACIGAVTDDLDIAK